MAMTYKELLESIQHMTPEQQGMDVTVFVQGVDEFYSLVGDFPFVTVDDETRNESIPGAQESALDHGHPYLVI